MNTITLRDMANIIATSEKRAEEKVFNQLKGLAGRNILTAVPDIYGKKGALLFPQEEIYRARMLLAALDNGFAAEALAKFDSQMRSESRESYADGKHVERGLHHAIAALAVGTDKWVFQIGQLRVDGELDFSGHWAINGRHGSAPDWLAPPPDGFEYDCAGSFEAVSTIMFTNICQPIFAEIERREKVES
ncbi:hypothetical protein [Fuscovulum blasticum]|uniref:hypothetical protein n=1 Tax=Fuscovulum blasticum TaxID=1075 RepID=UPI000D3EE0D9|nr:hypothetical protein [Fuscovulum blasticum]AWD21108.1 hypothetical protein B6K69_05030 [Fuscovulum blasticum]